MFNGSDLFMNMIRVGLILIFGFKTVKWGSQPAAEKILSLDPQMTSLVSGFFPIKAIPSS